MSRLNHQIADAILKSPYFVAAGGCRDVGHDELYKIIKAIKNTSKFNVDDLLDELREIEKYSPAAIALNKWFLERNCEGYTESKCNCFYPDGGCWLREERENRLYNSDYRHTREYKEWRKSVFERDKFTCQQCHQKGGELNAHHIKTFKDNPESRYDIGNGTTLCVGCHRSLHREG